MGILRDFKEFALKGNIVDLAVAVIIGAAFGAIISSMVDDVVTPLLLTPALKAAHAADLDSLKWGAVKYGKFLSSIIKFVLIAFILFLTIKAIHAAMKAKAEAPAAPAEPSSTDKLLMEIRDELRK